MANSTVKVNLGDGHAVDLLTDSPNIGALVEEIVKIKDDLDIDAITVECDLDSFDVKSFTEVIKESVRSFVNELQIEKDKFEAVLNDLRA